MEENMDYEYDWMNPESDKFYKGYRHKQSWVNDYLTETWCDGNIIRRKEINYYKGSNKNKEFEIYRNSKETVHNEDGPAVIKYKENGDIEGQEYRLNGYKFTEDDWKEEVPRLKLFSELYWDKYNERIKIQDRLNNEKYPSKELLNKDFKKYISLKNEMIEICDFIGFTPER